jgi:TolB-like protein
MLLRVAGVLALSLIATAPSSASSDTDLESTRDVLLVLELKTAGVDADTAAAVDQFVAETLAANVDMPVITREDLATVASHQKNLGKLDCDDQDCIVNLSKAANARMVLSGSIGEVGGRLLLTLSLLDADKAASIASSSRTTSDAEGCATVLPEMIAELFGGQLGADERTRYRLPAGREVSMAVFDIKAFGLSEDVARNLTQVLADEIKRVEGTKVISRDDMVALLDLEVEKLKTLDCPNNATSCLAEIGGALGVEKLVVGHAGLVADSYLVSLRLIGVQSVNVDSRITESFQGLESQLLPAVRHAGRRLLGIEATEPGALALNGSQAEAVVQLDNETVGALPIHPLEQQAPGRHTVRIVRTGFEDWRTDVYVEPGGVTTLWADLQETPPAWYERWWVWAILGGVAIAGGSIYYWQETRLPNSDLGTFTAN